MGSTTDFVCATVVSKAGFVWVGSTAGFAWVGSTAGFVCSVCLARFGDGIWLGIERVARMAARIVPSAAGKKDGGDEQAGAQTAAQWKEQNRENLHCYASKVKIFKPEDLRYGKVAAAAERGGRAAGLKQNLLPTERVTSKFQRDGPRRHATLLPSYIPAPPCKTFGHHLKKLRDWNHFHPNLFSSK